MRGFTGKLGGFMQHNFFRPFLKVFGGWEHDYAHPVYLTSSDSTHGQENDLLQVLTSDGIMTVSHVFICPYDKVALLGIANIRFWCKHRDAVSKHYGIANFATMPTYDADAHKKYHFLATGTNIQSSFLRQFCPTTTATATVPSGSSSASVSVTTASIISQASHQSTRPCVPNIFAPPNSNSIDGDDDGDDSNDVDNDWPQQ